MVEGVSAGLCLLENDQLCNCNKGGKSTEKSKTEEKFSGHGEIIEEEEDRYEAENQSGQWGEPLMYEAVQVSFEVIAVVIERLNAAQKLFAQYVCIQCHSSVYLLFTICIFFRFSRLSVSVSFLISRNI